MFVRVFVASIFVCVFALSGKTAVGRDHAEEPEGGGVVVKVQELRRSRPEPDEERRVTPLPDLGEGEDDRERTQPGPFDWHAQEL
jgi:hypothetical protein